MTARTLAAVLVALLTLAAASPASASVFEGRFAMSIRVVHAHLIYDRHVGQHMTRTLRVRRSCNHGRCHYSYGLEDRFGTFVRHPLKALSESRYRGRETFHRSCRNGGADTSRAVLDLHIAASALRDGRDLVSRATGTFRSRTTGCNNGAYEAWTFTAARTDLPDPLPVADADFGFEPEQPTVTANRNTVFFTDASGGRLVDWRWDFGDSTSGAANSSTGQSPSHLYAMPGVYRVTLTVTDERGLTDSTQQVIEIGP